MRNIHVMRQVLGAALTRATREELIGRNVARLVELPAWEPGEVHPWSADEALAFLQAAKPDPLYPAFVLLLLYGMRRGEVLGLRWQDVDLDDGVFRVRQQLQRVSGSLQAGPVKTKAGNRDLPIPSLARAALLSRQEQQVADRQAFGRAWQDTGLVFSTRSGLPIEPRNLIRSFRRICDHNELRVIKVHHLRHTTASLLKKLRVPPRDAQMILGHAHISTTMQIYTTSTRKPATTPSPGSTSCSVAASDPQLWSTMVVKPVFQDRKRAPGDQPETLSGLLEHREVELRRFELLTSCMPCKRSTN